jgi:hypothetical protein
MQLSGPTTAFFRSCVRRASGRKQRIALAVAILAGTASTSARSVPIPDAASDRPSDMNSSGTTGAGGASGFGGASGTGGSVGAGGGSGFGGTSGTGGSVGTGGTSGTADVLVQQRLHGCLPDLLRPRRQLHRSQERARHRQLRRDLRCERRLQEQPGTALQRDSRALSHGHILRSRWLLLRPRLHGPL